MDLVDIALAHAQLANVTSYVLALGAGVATSIGPCVAPRYAAVAAIASSGDRARLGRLLAFVAGTLTVYMAVATVGSVVIRLAQATSVIYYLLALALIVGGIVQLVRDHDHGSSAQPRHVPSFGAAFLLGAATSSTVSPCCTPILLGLGALSATTSGISTVAGLVVAFTVGHIAPVLVLFGAAGLLKSLLSNHGGAVATVAAAVTIALGCYYAVLA